MKKNVIILGAAGRDYEDFLQYFKDNPEFNVVCFTQAQIPGIEKRSFPKQLAGKLYKKDIPFYPEEKLPELIKKFKIDYVYLCYSDLSAQEVLNKASVVLANGANFALLGTKSTYLESKKPVISVTAVRTGCGKSRVSKRIALYLKNKNYKIVNIRHPMPYGDLRKQEVEKFYTEKDLVKYKATIEEREEYEQYVKNKVPIFAGVDYEKILREAEKEADVILWDGGNNDFSFVRPDLNIVIVDPRRAGHELSYYPGQVNLRMADIILIHKMSGTTKENLKLVHDNIKKANSKAKVIEINSVISVENPEEIRNKTALLIGDGPTLTHGGMAHGVADAIAEKYHLKVIDAEKYAVGSIKQLYKKFTHLKKVLPAMGYSDLQIKELQETINKAKCDIVIDGSPANLKLFIKVNKPIYSSDYDIMDKELRYVYGEIDKILK
ncbi:MAG: GTPase [Nanoarchaeota archaeon]